MSSLDIPNACTNSANEAVGTTSLAAASCNLSHLDNIANSTELTATSRTGIVRDTITGFNTKADTALNDLGNSFGFIIQGDFTTGFTITNRNQVGQATDGTIWRYTGALPFTVPAGTTPSSPTYNQLVETDHNELTNLDALGGHDAIYRRKTTVAEIESGAFASVSLPLKLEVTDRDNSKFELLASGTPDGYGVINAGSGRVARAEVGIIVNPLTFGMIGDNLTINTAAFNAMFSFVDGGYTTINIIGGPFLIDGKVDIPSNTTLTGTGVIKYTNEHCYLDILQKENVTVSNITIDGDFDSYVATAATGDTRSIWVNRGSSGVLIDNVTTFKVLRQAIYIGSGSANNPVAPENIEVRSCHIYDIGSPLDPISANFGNGVVISAGKKINVHHNVIERIHGTGGINSEGITLTREDITIAFNEIDTVTSTLVSPASARGVRFNGSAAAGEVNSNIKILFNTVKNTAGSAYYVADMQDIDIHYNKAFAAGVNGFEVLGEDDGHISLTFNEVDGFTNRGMSITNGEYVTFDDNTVKNGYVGSDAGMLYRKGTSLKKLSVDNNTVDNVQLDGMQLAGNNFTYVGNKISRIGQIGSGNNRAISTPSGTTPPVNENGVIDNNVFDASSGSVQAFVFAETNRWVGTKFGSGNTIIGNAEEIRSNFSTTYQMINGTYPNRPDIGGTGSTAAWSKGDTIRNLTPDAGDYFEWVCVTSGTPGTWRGLGLIES